MDTVIMLKRYGFNKPKQTMKVSLADVNKVLKHLDHIEDKLALNIAIWNVMRPAEIFGLDFKHDFGDRLFINQTWNDLTKELRPVKNDNSRYSPIVEPFREVLDEYYDDLKKFNIPYTPDSPLVGVSKRMATSTVRNRMIVAIQKAGVDYFAWMNVRKSVIAELLANGNKPYIIANIAGHLEAMITDVYTQ